MSNQDPGTDSPLEQSEVVGPPARRAGTTRRSLAAFIAVALGAGAVGAAVWAWQAWAQQGPQPAQALPGNTLAYAALDLDPPGGQKLAAYNTLRKFPSLKRSLGLDSVDDLHRSVVDQFTSDNDCDLGYGDVKPWLGDRIAIAVVAQKHPESVLVLQVKDASAARSTLDAASGDCDFGYVVAGDWAVLAGNDAVADRVVADARDGRLADDKEFRSLTEAAGDPGLVTLYAAPEAGQAALDSLEENPYAVAGMLPLLTDTLDPATSYLTLFALSTSAGSFEGEMVASDDSYPDVSPELRKKQRKLDRQFAHFDELTPKQRKRLIREQQQLADQMFPAEDLPEGDASDDEGDPDGFGEEFPTPEIDPAVRTALEQFSGLGGIGRFTDGALELEIVGDDLKGLSGDMYAGSAGGDLVSDLPQDTALAFGAGLADDWVDALFRRIDGQFYGFDESEDSAVEEFETSTGLDVPADLEALGGDGVTFVVGAGFSPDRLYEDFTGQPVAVRITGDADRIEAALDKLRAGLDREDAARILSRRAGAEVLVGANAGYLDALAGGGDLGGSDGFRTVAPDADGSTSVSFVNFDAGDWAAKAAESDGDREDIEPLDTLGLTTTKKGGEQRIVLRATFD